MRLPATLNRTVLYLTVLNGTVLYMHRDYLYLNFLIEISLSFSSIGYQKKMDRVKPNSYFCFERN